MFLLLALKLTPTKKHTFRQLRRTSDLFRNVARGAQLNAETPGVDDRRSGVACGWLRRSGRLWLARSVGLRRHHRWRGHHRCSGRQLPLHQVDRGDPGGGSLSATAAGPSAFTRSARRRSFSLHRSSKPWRSARPTAPCPSCSKEFAGLPRSDQVSRWCPFPFSSRLSSSW